MKEGQKYLLAFAIVAVIALVAGLACYGYMPVTNPFTPPGPEPEVTVKTDVTIVRTIWGHTYIDSIRNQIVAQPYYEYKAGVAILPFTGTLTVKVVYPSGAELTVGNQRIAVDLGGTLTVTFFWKTKQSGSHTVVATMYDENGIVVDQKSESFYVPER